MLDDVTVPRIGMLRRLSEEEEGKIKAMWEARFSASWIAAKLPELGLSRCAVIGIVNRRGWTGGSCQVGRPTKLPRPAPQIARSPEVSRTQVRRFAPTIRRPTERVLRRSVHVADLQAHHCRWVKGEVRDLMYCGAPKDGESSYCARHHKLAVQPASERHKKKAEGFRLPPLPAPNFF